MLVSNSMNIGKPMKYLYEGGRIGDEAGELLELVVKLEPWRASMASMKLTPNISLFGFCWILKIRWLPVLGLEFEVKSQKCFSTITHSTSGCVACKLCSPHSHITYHPFTHSTSGCVTCKLCSSHSHITFPPSPIQQVAVSPANFAAHTVTLLFHHHPFNKWLCHLQTLQLTQPHHFSTITHSTSGYVTCKLCSSHSHITFPPSPVQQVAALPPNFAAHTATSLSVKKKSR